MPLIQDMITSRYRISGYHDDSITINETCHRSSLIVSAGTLYESWPVDSIVDLTEDTLKPIFDLHPDVVLLGTGIRQQFPAPKIMALFGSKGIGLEAMDNGALCRTFNILVAEDRSVVAAVIIPSV